VLTYHAVPERLGVAQLNAEGTGAALNGATLGVCGTTVVDAGPMLRDARFVPVQTDFAASNGAVQVVDSVLLHIAFDLPGPALRGTIADQLAASGSGFDGNRQNFDVLNVALGAAGLTAIQSIDRVMLPLDVPQAGSDSAPLPTLADPVDASGNGFDGNRHDFDLLNAALELTGFEAALDDAAAKVTLRAPTDAAFVRFAQRLGFQGEDEEGASGAIAQTLTTLGEGNSIPLLTDILSYQVLDGRFSRQQMQAEGSAETLLGPDLGFRGSRSRDAGPGYEVRFEGGGNVRAANGAQHAIDNVLLLLNLDVIGAGSRSAAGGAGASRPACRAPVIHVRARSARR
jgi:uncharacterized surface protein with fasciclin (FAS1) repeats